MGKEDIRAYAQAGGKPKEGTLMRQVFDAIEAGVPLDSLITDTLSRKQITAASKGLTYFGYTQETESLSMAPRSAEFKAKMSEIQGGISNTCLPLLLRGGSIPDIVAITKFEYAQVERVVTNARRKGTLPRPTEKQTRIAKSKALRGKPRHTQGRNYTKIDIKRQEIAKKLLDSGLITENLTYWNKLHELYAHYRRKLPRGFTRQIHLEGMLVAQLHMAVNRVDVSNTYDAAINSIDPRIKIGEEQFLKRVLMAAKIQKNVSDE